RWVPAGWRRWSASPEGLLERVDETAGATDEVVERAGELAVGAGVQLLVGGRMALVDFGQPSEDVGVAVGRADEGERRLLPQRPCLAEQLVDLVMGASGRELAADDDVGE